MADNTRNVRKKRKKSHAQTLPEDRISTLPEGILHHILSFLEIKELVQTSFFSRRWTYVWKSVQDLNFDYSLWAQPPHNRKTKGPHLKKVLRKNDCMNFVDRVLFIYRDKTEGVRKIKLSHLYCHDSGRLATWFLCLLPNLKEAYLEIPKDKLNFVLPDFLFTSKLELFDLRTVKPTTIERSVQLPSNIASNCYLQTIFLNSCALPQGDGKGELVLKNPMLKNLTLDECNHGVLSTLNLTAPQLKELVVNNCCQPGVNSCEIKLCTPNLTRLELLGECYKDYSLGNLSSLVRAKIGPPTLGDSYLHVRYMVEVLPALNNVSSLELVGSYKFKELAKEKLDVDQLLHLFSNLRWLKLTKPTCVFTVTKFLNSAPSITTLVLEWGIIHEKVKVGNWRLELPWKDTFHHLRHLKVANLYCEKIEIKFVTFLLRNSMALEKITVTHTKWAKKYREKELAEFKEQLHSLPKASSSAAITFVVTPNNLHHY